MPTRTPTVMAGVVRHRMFVAIGLDVGDGDPVSGRRVGLRDDTAVFRSMY
jgi:hypothetical protein